jgi:anti-sigma B factor antagonist
MSRPQAPPDSIAGRAHALAPPFACFWTKGGLNAAWVQVLGELDIDTTPQLERTLREPKSQLVVLDLRELAFMDSSGVHTIVNASARARRLGRRLVLLRGPPDVDRVFRLTGNSADVENGDVASIGASIAELPLLDGAGGAS